MRQFSRIGAEQPEPAEQSARAVGAELDSQPPIVARHRCILPVEQMPRFCNPSRGSGHGPRRQDGDVTGETIFHGTAWYYARYRPGYPQELFDLLRGRFELDGTGRLLDLGCGTGQLAVPLAPLFEEVVAVDVDAGMLAELNAVAPANL